MGKYINVAVAFPHKGKHYQGFTVHPGVDMSTAPAPCLPKTQFLFSNTDEFPKDENGNINSGIYVEGASGAEVSDSPRNGFLGLIGGYLQIMPS